MTENFLLIKSHFDVWFRGTLIVILIMSLSRETLVSMAFAFVLAYAACGLFSFLPTGVVEGIIMLASFFGMHYFLKGTIKQASCYPSETFPKVYIVCMPYFLQFLNCLYSFKWSFLQLLYLYNQGERNNDFHKQLYSVLSLFHRHDAVCSSLFPFYVFSVKLILPVSFPQLFRLLRSFVSIVIA